METHAVLLLLAMFARVSGLVLDVTSGEWIRQGTDASASASSDYPSSLEKRILNTKSTNVNAACKSSEVRVYQPSRMKQ